MKEEKRIERLNITLKPSTLEKLKKIAKEESRSMNNTIEILIESW
jgi:hypothetical protein